MSTQERLARLEGIIEQIGQRLDSIDTQLNTLTLLLGGTWITTVITILAVGVAQFLQITEVAQ